MKHNILAASLLTLGAMALPATANAANIRNLGAINNKTAYVIKRQGNSGTIFGSLYYLEGSDICQAKSSGISADSPEAQWSIHYSESEKGYFLYNMGAGKFLTGNSKSQAVFTDEAIKLTPVFLDNAGYWILDCGGYVLGLEKADKGAVIFADEVTRTNYKDTGFCFTIADTPNRELTDEEQNLIEQKIKSGRQAAIDRYKEFVEKAEAMLTKESDQKYAGAYPLSEIKHMLENPGKYTLTQFEEAYNRAVAGRLPQYGYYRLHNQNRPGSYTSNGVVVKEDGQLVSIAHKTPTFGIAPAGYQEDLSLFSLIPDGGPWNVRLYDNASGKFATCGSSNNSKAWLDNEPSKATVFILDPNNDYKRQFRLKFANADDAYITVSGNNELVAWNKVETSMQFWFEKVSEIDVTTDANGYLSLILPANVTLPEGVQAWVVSSVRDGKAYVEEIFEGVGAQIPFIIKAAPNTVISLPTASDPVWYQTAMVGSNVKAEIGARQEIVSTPSGLKFEVKEAGTVNPGTAFILTDETAPLEIVMGADPESSIEEISADSGLDLFDLQGRIVSGTPRPGLYINAATKKVVRIK